MHIPKFFNLKSAALIAALIMMSACSSSKIEDGAEGAPETASAAETSAAASTDAVPMADAPAAEQKSVAEVDSNASAPAVTGLDSPAPVAAAANPAPVAEAPVVDTPVGSNTVVPPAEPSLPASEPQVTEGGKAYRVKSGDTLMKIAFEKYGDLYRWKEIYEANRGKIQDPNHVPPGTELTLNGSGMVTIERNGERYLIKHGDTLGLISNDVYGTTAKWKKLWENNRQLIKDPNKIYAGFSLYYVPEARLTHDEPEAAPAPTGGSAQNLPFKNKPVEKAVATLPAPSLPNVGAVAPVNAPTLPAQDAVRTPASSK